MMMGGMMGAGTGRRGQAHTKHRAFHQDGVSDIDACR